MHGCTVKAPLVNTCVLWSVFDLNHMKHTVDCFVNIRRHKVITYCHAHVQGFIIMDWTIDALSFDNSIAQFFLLIIFQQNTSCLTWAHPLAPGPSWVISCVSVEEA